ncbi:MAG: hypothetical protein RBS68_03815 [Anaerolineales bacterium]|jgi:hypothetical protein|nr:hypothetical protein [Anaerolineales bacterium]
MTVEFNERGKYFTDIISKISISAIIQTTTHRIEGAIHVRPDERIKDELDRQEPFLAVTDAKVFGPDGSALHQAEFMSIARAQIVWVIPSENTTNTGEA